MCCWSVQVTQLCSALDALLESESGSAEVLECFFLEALYCSLGASLLQSGRMEFDEFIRRISCLTVVHDEKTLAGPGEIPGKEKNAFLRHPVWVISHIVYKRLGLGVHYV